MQAGKRDCAFHSKVLILQSLMMSRDGIMWEQVDCIKALEGRGGFQFQFSAGIPHEFWCEVWE